jgi:virulence-associated protein VapD
MLEIAVNKNRISVRVKGVELYTIETLDNITTVIRIETLIEKAFSEEAKMRALVRTLADLTKTVSEVETLHIESMSRPEYT